MGAARPPAAAAALRSRLCRNKVPTLTPGWQNRGPSYPAARPTASARPGLPGRLPRCTEGTVAPVGVQRGAVGISGGSSDSRGPSTLDFVIFCHSLVDRNTRPAWGRRLPGLLGGRYGHGSSSPPCGFASDGFGGGRHERSNFVPQPNQPPPPDRRPIRGSRRRPVLMLLAPKLARKPRAASCPRRDRPSRSLAVAGARGPPGNHGSFPVTSGPLSPAPA